MAFNDIKAWREIMDADEQERACYDKACAAAERRAAEAAQKEYDEIEQASVDPATCACGRDGGCVCLDDLEDDEVDFSAYGVSEADLGVGPADELYPTARDLAREPLVRIPAALGRPASDADLAAQDVVRLMAETLKKALGKPVDEANSWENFWERNNATRDGVFGEDMAKCLNDMDEKMFAGATVELRFRGNPEGRRLPGSLSDRSGGAKVVGFRNGTLVLGFDDKRQKVGVGEFIRQLKDAGAKRMRDVRLVELQGDPGSKQDYSMSKYAGFFPFGDPPSINICFAPSIWRGDRKEEYADFLAEEDGGKDAGLGSVGPVDDKIEQMAQDGDYPLSDADWAEIDGEPSYQKKIDLIQSKIKDRWPALSPEAKRRVRDDVMGLRGEFLKSRWGEKQFKEALRLQQISRKRELTDEEKKKFSDIVRFGLDDAQRAELEKNLYANGYRIPREGRTTKVPASDAQSGNVTDHHKGEGSGERSNETGLDSEFDINKFQYVPEPMTPGTDVPADFNPAYGPEETAPNMSLQRDVDDVARSLEPGHAARKKAWARQDASRYIDDNGGDDFYTDSPKLWKQLVGMLDPDEIEEVTADLANELPGSKADNRRMMDYMLGGMKLTQTAMGAQAGYGADQKGRTGGLTQQGDKLMNLLLFALATHLNVATDHLERFWKNLKSENTAQRNVRKELRPVIFDEICAELGVDVGRIGREIGVVPAYSAGVKAKRAADKLLMTLFVREYDQMSAAERDALRQTFQAYQNGSKIVKLYTGLDDDQNSEFQDLIFRMRDEGDLPNEDRVRLMQLDLMRRNPGMGEDAAHAQAERKYSQMTQNGEGPFVDYTTRLAKAFVRGHSPHHTRDTITNPERASS